MSARIDHYMMLKPEELAIVMPLCQDVSRASRRDKRTPITPEQGVAMARAVEEARR